MGTFMANFRALKMSNQTCFICILLELILTGLILASVLTTKHSDKSWQAALSLPAIMTQGFVHSMTATHFLTMKPALSEVPLEYQAQAGVLRVLTKDLGIMLGLLVQFAIIVSNG